MRFSSFLAGIVTIQLTCAAPDPGSPLPNGARAVWDLAKAYRQSTSTRENVSLNGLWQWQPAEAPPESPPSTNWGYFKVPGSWPGITDYMQKDSQTVLAHSTWAGRQLGSVTTAWYQREITVPQEWAGRRIVLDFEYLNSYAIVFLDNVKVAEARFPGGEVDLTSACRPGSEHLLSIAVAALPLKGVMLSYTDTASAREVKGAVARRGLCGDVSLRSTPRGARLRATTVETSVRRGEIRFQAALDEIAEEQSYSLHIRISRNNSPVREFNSPPFSKRDLLDGSFSLTQSWKPDALWDIHTPQNIFDAEITLFDSASRVLDTGFSERFGFREFSIDGRDFYLNGSRIFLSALPLDNAQVSTALATYAGARESLERLKSFGINFVYTHNYDCLPGSHLSFAEILKAADDAGMLVALTQPHFSHYDWTAPSADQTNGYAQHAAFYARYALNHPSVVLYSMSHNATGYSEDMNPDLIDGKNDPRDQWSSRNAQLALRAEAIVKRLDPTRGVYHHASGNLGSMHPINFYPNFVPVQELSDWFEHWSAEGVKPAFLCEYGAPFTWDWTLYRGWFKGQREFGSAQVPWEFCIAEWNAQFLGDHAYQISAPEKANLRWEAAQFRAGKLWHRWDYPFDVGSTRFEERYPVFSLYLDDNWRAFRTWGVSAISPWEHGHFWKLRDGVDKRRRAFPVDWENLQRPGFSPDYSEQRYERMDLAFDRSDWIPTAAAESLLRNNRPLLAYLAGKPAAFTSKDHNFVAGETIDKQIVLLNNSRESTSVECTWSLALPAPITGQESVTLETGQQKRLPLRFALPPTLPPGRYELAARFQFSNGEAQADRFSIDVVSPPKKTTVSARIALFDPEGQTTVLLRSVGISFDSIQPAADLANYDLLIVGKAALTRSGAAPDIRRVRDGLKVLLFEQTADVLEKRFGFRVQEYGLRQLFPRVPDHPVLAHLDADHLRDWRGAATLVPPRLKYEMRPRYGPTVLWCDIPVARLWRCGNRGNVASVLIEKPTRGDFLPIADGGFSLQYSPLLEYHEGRGLVLFCQLDVSGRTEPDPAAFALARNLLEYALAWTPAPHRTAVYAGAPEGKAHLESAGVPLHIYEGGPLAADSLLILSPGSTGKTPLKSEEFAEFLKSGGTLLGIGLEPQQIDVLLPSSVELKRAEHIAAYFDPQSNSSAFAGVSPADVHNRDPRDLPLVSARARILGNGVLAQTENGRVVFCQIAPWAFAGNIANLRRTHRRVSFALTRILGNLGVQTSTPLLDRFSRPVAPHQNEQRWREGFYLDVPEEWDDPYRFFRW